jgi:hypothetical protein
LRVAAVSVERPSSSRRRIAAFAAAALVLAWLVISKSLAAYLADGAAPVALQLNANEPAALVNLADRMFAAPASSNAADIDGGSAAPQPRDADNAVIEGKTAPASGTGKNPAFSAFELFAERPGVDLSMVRALIAASLRNAPLDARAMRILGQAADIAKDHAKAQKLMSFAAQLSLHDPIAIYWLIIDSAERKDYKTTLYYADIFMRGAPELGQYLLPILARIAEDKNSGELLHALLLTDPPWRSQFLQQLPNNVQDVRTPLQVLLALRSSAVPPTSVDVNRYLTYLIAHKFYDLAYYTWLQFLPGEALGHTGYLYNGSFQNAPSGSPFDWLITQGSGVTVDIQARPDRSDGHALVLNFNYGRVEYQSVTQLIKLPAGRYHFTGRYEGELVGPRGLKWRLACAEQPATYFAESDMISARAAAWRAVAFDFKVPEQNCRAQHLSLDLDARMPSERFITGTIWFDDLRISRLEDQAGH